MHEHSKTAIPIGLGSVLQLQTKANKERHSCQLVGMEHGKYLIVKFDKALEGKLKVGSVMVLRFLHKGVIYGFQTVILSQLFNPDKLSILSYPAATENMDLRASPRVECFLPAHLLIGDLRLDGPIVDISLKGCSVGLRKDDRNDRATIKNAVDQQLIISFQLPGVTGFVDLPATLRRCEPGQMGLSLGIQFHEPADTIKPPLYSFLVQVNGLPEEGEAAMAVGQHMIWKNKLLLFMENRGGLTRKEVETLEETELGRWLDGAGRDRFGNHPDFNALVRCTQSLHEMLQPVLEKKAKGDTAGATAAFKSGSFSAQSQKIIGILLKMEQSERVPVQ